MNENDVHALSDVAYGLFEVFLNRELHGRGQYLFERVEQGVDFSVDFLEIFATFSEDYPQLAEALTERFGAEDALYRMICAGEGVVPSCTTQMFWIVQDAPDILPVDIDDERAGKWLIFVEKNDADRLWAQIRDTTVSGNLGTSAKVSTAKENPDSRDERYVIYVFTADWSNEADVMGVREKLRSFGVEQRIGYKRNIETYHGEYSDETGKKVTYYSA